MNYIGVKRLFSYAVFTVLSGLIVQSPCLADDVKSSVGVSHIAQPAPPSVANDFIQSEMSIPANLTAHQTIELVTERLAQTLTLSSELYKKTPDIFYQKVEGVLSPAINFDKITRGVMGSRYYRQASSEQRQQFITVFRSGLIRTYAKGLLGFNQSKIEVLPPKNNVSGKKKVIVKQKIYGQDGVYPLSYSMSINKDAKWRLYNVTINGINLGLTFRNQFAQSMKDHGGDIDQVITNWTSSVESTSS